MSRSVATGRSAGFNPPNRFERLHVEKPPDDLTQYFEDPDPDRKILTQFYLDHTKSILAKNDSPDLGFTYSINPYRGCEHGCIYCYARPSHEYLGFSSGLDFETKILVKQNAAALLEEQFQNRAWKPQVIVFSGNTDCYRPIERALGLTRKCLQVFLKYRNPVSIITKNALVQRDADILQELASLNMVLVVITVTTLDSGLVRKMEPRTSTPAKRLETIEMLASKGIPVGVNIAPIIPGLNDVEIPAILREISDCGARYANYSILRLPNSVEALFLEWLGRELPAQAPRILKRIRDIRDGKLSDSTFGKRMTGEGQLAHAIEQLFEVNRRKFGLSQKSLMLSVEHFLKRVTGQPSLF